MKANFFLLVVAFSSVRAYSAGAPEDVCDDMTPQHPVAPQTTTFPYTVTVNPTVVNAGEKLQITVAPGDEKTFKGFLLQVRNGNKAVGAFNVSDDDKFAKTINCHGAEKSAATHKNSSEKKTLTFEWVAPKELKGSVDVYATVAKDGGVFWVRQKQTSVKIN